MPATPDQSAGRGGPAPDPRALASLLGTTRAQVLQQIANMAPATTNGVAGALEVSAATVSHHTGVLSRSRLITTRRDGASVRHMLTPLGRSLLRAHGLPAAPSAPPMVWAGDLACTRYTSGQRLFDLPDRCIPAPLLNDHLDDDTCLTRLLENAATVLGIATAADFADYVRIRAATAQRLLPHTALTPVAVQGWGWGPAFAHPRALNMPQAAPREPVFLNPFDNLIWHRPRVQRLFDFTHIFEAYKPATRREHGYYVCPLLADGRLIARADLSSTLTGLTIRRASFEEHAGPNALAQFAGACHAMAATTGTHRITIAADAADPLTTAALRNSLG